MAGIQNPEKSGVIRSESHTELPTFSGLSHNDWAIKCHDDPAQEPTQEPTQNGVTYTDT